MPNRQKSKRSRTRRAGESAYGLLLLVKQLFMTLVAVLLIGVGAWTSWETASTAMQGDTRGTLKVTACGADTCSGPFTPAAGQGDARGKVTISSTVSGKPGDTLDVALRDGSGEQSDGKAGSPAGSTGNEDGQAVRTGPAGILYAWMPLAGALLLASLVVAGGLRMRRTAWTLGALGALMMAGAWALLHLL